MNKLLQHIINAGDVDHKILPSLLKMDEGGELIKLKDSKGRVREYNTESRKYKRLYDQGKIGSWSKFDQGSGKWVSSDASDPNAEFVSSPKILPEVVVSSKVKPNSLGSYSSSFYKENPYEDFYRNRYQQEKEEFESAPGWAQQSVGGWDRDSRQKNIRDQINQEYQQKYIDYVSQMLQKRNPQGSQRRDEWLSKKNFSDKELGYLTGSSNLPQPSLWAQGLQGAYNVGDMLAFGKLPEQNMPGISKAEVSQYNSPLLALSPLSIPAKVVQSAYKDNYSIGDALMGRPNNASVAEDIFTDPFTYATFGAKSAINAAPRLGRFMSNLGRGRSVISSLGKRMPAFSGVADDVARNASRLDPVLANADQAENIMKRVEVGNNTIQNKGRKLFDELSSPEGINRLRQQFKMADPSFTDEQLDWLVGNRLNEVNDAIRLNQNRYLLERGKGAAGTETENYLRQLFPYQNAHFSSWNPFPLNQVDAPLGLFPSKAAARGTQSGTLNLRKNSGLENFANPNYTPGSISLGEGLEDNVRVLDHELGHALQNTGHMPVDEDLLNLIRPKNAADRLWKKMLPNESKEDLKYFTYSGGRTYQNEPYAFLAEQRRRMIEDGVLSGRYDKVTPMKLIQARLNAAGNSGRNFMEGNRLIKFTPFWKYPQLAKIMNTAPAAIPTIGVGTYMATQLGQPEQPALREEGGENKEYTGSSIVDYLATKGYSGNKKFRKELAEKYGVEGYDYTAKKNLELLSKLRENDDALEAFEQNFVPISAERIEEIERKNQERARKMAEVASQDNEKKIGIDEFNRRMSLMLGYDVSQGVPKDRFKVNAPKLSLSPKVEYDKFSLVPRMNYKGINLSVGKAQSPQPPIQQQAAPAPAKQPAPVNTGFRFDLNPTVKQGVNPYPFYNPFIPGNMTVAGANIPVAPARVNTSKPQQKQTAVDKPWYEDTWDVASSAYNTAEDFASDVLNTAGTYATNAWNGITNTVGNAWDNVSNTVSDAWDRAYNTVDDALEWGEDWYEKYQNNRQRSSAKSNPNLVERKSAIDPTKLKYDPVYVTGDTLKDNARRYHIPEVMDLDYMRFGVRNRGDYNELNTEGAPITTFEPFVSSKKYFATSKDPANATYIGVSADGKVKVGTKDKFQDKEYQITRTYGNKVVDFNRDNTGKIVKVPSNPKASKETLSPSVKVLGDDGKIVDGKLSLLLPREGNQEQSYDLVTGGRYIFQTPDGKTKLVSGSLKNIEDEFYRMKGKHPWLNVITLDNGSYSRGIRTYDQKLTRKDLKGYDNQNTGGGNFLYLLPGQKKTRYDSKFFDFEQEAKKRLQAKYPGRKVEIRFQNEGLYDETGGRDIESQISIQKKGNSQTPVSLHNFSAARDYILYVDGKPINADANKQLYKDVLWSASDATGTYHLEDWDPAHISLAKEGQKTAFDELAKKYPDIWANPNFQRSLQYINKNKDNSTYEEYFEMLNNIAEFTGQPKVTEVMKRKGWSFNKEGKIVDKKGRLVNKASGGAVIDPRGQWAYPGMDTIVPTASGAITMQGVSYPVYGEDETGYGQMMMPGGEYHFPGQMVYETPMMKSGGQHGGLDRWFAERWVDVKTGKTCGRQEGENRAYPACRPSRRVSSQTPKTSSEMSPAEKAKFKRSKTSSQRINYNHKRN